MSDIPVLTVEVLLRTATDHPEFSSATVSLDQVVPAPLLPPEELCTSASAATTDTTASEDCNPSIITRRAKYARLSHAQSGGRSCVQRRQHLKLVSQMGVENERGEK